MILVFDYGQPRLEVGSAKAKVNKAVRTTRWETTDLIIEVSGYPCRDTMSGEEFESTVEVWTEDQTFLGWGRTLY